MSPPLVGVEEGGQTNKIHNYFGFSDSSSVDSSTVTTFSCNLKATELRLGLPGSQSPDTESDTDADTDTNPDPCHEEKPLFPITPFNFKDAVSSSSQSLKPHVSGSKRGFSDTVEHNFVDKLPPPPPPPTQANWIFKSSSIDSDSSKLPVNVMRLSSNPNSFAAMDDPCASQAPAKPRSNTTNPVPASKAQVVGWPPIRSFRKNTLATTSKNSDPLFVKVSMEGAPYLRKVDLRTYTTYHQLSSGLEKMFSGFTLGQCGPDGASGSDNLNETKLKDLLHGSEYVLTYEDKDGDWMLVGDVPWEMFIDTCKRLKIMKSSDAIGLAPRDMERFKGNKLI